MQNSLMVLNEAINEMASIDFEIMDVKLEMKLREQFKAHNQIPTRRLVNDLMLMQWFNYTRLN